MHDKTIFVEAKVVILKSYYIVYMEAFTGNNYLLCYRYIHYCENKFPVNVSGHCNIYFLLPKVEDRRLHVLSLCS